MLAITALPHRPYLWTRVRMSPLEGNSDAGLSRSGKHLQFLQGFAAQRRIAARRQLVRHETSATRQRMADFATFIPSCWSLPG